MQHVVPLVVEVAEIALAGQYRRHVDPRDSGADGTIIGTSGHPAAPPGPFRVSSTTAEEG